MENEFYNQDLKGKNLFRELLKKKNFKGEIEQTDTTNKVDFFITGKTKSVIEVKVRNYSSTDFDKPALEVLKFKELYQHFQRGYSPYYASYFEKNKSWIIQDLTIYCQNTDQIKIVKLNGQKNNITKEKKIKEVILLYTNGISGATYNYS